MSTFEFATNQRHVARKYLAAEQMAYLTQETVEYIIDGVGSGICRVRDPHMYGGASGIVPETKDRGVWDPWIARFKELHSRDYRSRPEIAVLPDGTVPDGYAVEWGIEIGEDDHKHIFWRGTTHEIFGMDYQIEEARKTGKRLFRRVIGPAIEVDAQTRKDKTE